MIDFSNANITKLMIHGVGNKLKEDGMVLSNNSVKLSEDALINLLGKYFFQKFNGVSLYHFFHNTNLSFNEIYQYTNSIFQDLGSFEAITKNIATHLYDVSTHPNIKAGELSIAYITGINLDGNICNAIGIFKTETKEPYLKIIGNEQNLTVSWEQGIDTNKLDKGCIIFDYQFENGYVVLPVDNGSGIDTKYWKEDFLGIQKIDNSENKTRLVIEACKQFVKQDSLSDKKDKVLMLNNAIDYMIEKPQIELNDFTFQVANTINRSEDLKEFISTYAEKKNNTKIDNFSIDHSALKKMERNIRNFIKLDTNYEIKISRSSKVNMEYLEKGFDDQKQMYFYKIYFNKED